MFSNTVQHSLYECWFPVGIYSLIEKRPMGYITHLSNNSHIDQKSFIASNTNKARQLSRVNHVLKKLKKQVLCTHQAHFVVSVFGKILSLLIPIKKN